MVGKKFNFLRGTLRTGPLKLSKFQIFQKIPNMTSYNPIFFYCRIIKYYKNKDVCKKLELKILKFEKMADIFVMTKKFCDR